MANNTNKPITLGDLNRMFTTFRQFFLGTVRTYIDRRIVQLRTDSAQLGTRLANFMQGAASRFSDVDTELAAVRADIASLDSKLDLILTAISNHDNKLTGFRNGAVTRFDDVDTAVVTVQNTVDNIATELTDHRTEVENVNSNP